MRLDTIFLDLDGTIVESSKGILNSFRYTFEQLNAPQLSDEQLNSFIGPPLEATFQVLSDGDHEWAKKATDVYRQYYAQKGMFEAKPYEDITATLTQLQERGYNLYIATSKKEEVAIAMLNALGLAHHFRGIFGQTPETPTKALVLEKALTNTQSLPEHSVMIGDREYDIIGGLSNQVAKTIGVLWGFGSEAELLNAGSSEIITSPKQLLELFK